jgi:hypothetical protein
MPAALELLPSALNLTRVWNCLFLGVSVTAKVGQDSA